MDKHATRRMIMAAIDALDPAAASLADIAAHPRLRMAGIERGQICAGLAGLGAHGYAADLRPGREPLARLTAAGADQLNQETDLDEYVWGELASKFAH